MSEPYQVLYRKYRPQSFKEVIGQEHIVSILEAAVKAKKPAHAYLFSGSRGTGKTSVARILAKSLGTSDIDLHEIDAASNRGIDDIRELRDGVRSLPFESPYKVYIIDEVHMLTKEAFNALLKTLEEPPAHALFVLATTEFEKLPETIVSRCQTFSFKKPTEEILRASVEEIAKREKLKLEPEAAELIALLGDGSFRDAYGALQKVAEHSQGKTITRAEVENISGAPKQSLVDAFVTALLAGDLDRGLGAVREAEGAGLDMKLYAKLILHALRVLLFMKYAPKAAEALLKEQGSEREHFYTGLIEAHGKALSSRSLKELLGAYQDIGHSFVPGLPLELALVELLGQDK